MGLICETGVVRALLHASSRVAIANLKTNKDAARCNRTSGVYAGGSLAHYRSLIRRQRN
jgi:hypothetical protein